MSTIQIIEPGQALAAGAQLSTETRAALKVIVADLRATYDALANGREPQISVGQWGRLLRAEQLIEQMEA